MASTLLLPSFLSVPHKAFAFLGSSKIEIDREIPNIKTSGWQQSQIPISIPIVPMIHSPVLADYLALYPFFMHL